MPGKTPDSRHFTRIPFSATIEIVNTDGSWQGELLDISLKGALIEQPAGWNGRMGDHYRIEISLDDGDSRISMDTTVAHMEQHHIGLRCDHIDLDSITHLRRLVELNLGDESILHRELSELSGVRR